MIIITAVGQKRKPPASRPRTVEKRAPEPSPSTPQEALDHARSAATAKERILLLERFIASNGGTEHGNEALDLLLREYTLRGEQHLREGNPQLAIKDFKTVFRLAPSPMTDKVFGQYIFPMPVAMNAFGYRTESVELIRSFEGRFADDPNRLIQIGFFYIQIEAPLEAVRLLEDVVKKAPEESRAHNGLGTAYLINLRLDDALAAFQKAVELNPRDEFANLNLANMYRAMGNNERAVAYYRKQIAIKPDDAEARGGLAISLLLLGRDEEAEGEIKLVERIAPGDYRFLTQLAYHYTTRKKAAVARTFMERAARIDPRYAWVHITKANIDALESKYGDSLSTLIAAQAHGSFPTMTFELVKALMALDGYDQSLEVFHKAFSVTSEGEFEAVLGGVIRARSPRLDLLLDRERQASLFLNEHPTTSLQYRLAEAIARIDHYIGTAARAKKPAAPAASGRRKRPGAQSRSNRAREAERKQAEAVDATRPRRAAVAAPESSEVSAGEDASLPGMSELMNAISTFTTLDDGRQPFRMVWVARRLTENGIALDAAEQLARRAIAVADPATEPAGSMRDTPLLDREGRRAVFLGRAYDVLGWTLFKKGNLRAAIDFLSKSVDSYPPSAERKAALWHLAVATEEAGDEQRALDLYISSYQPDTPISAVRRAQLETLYKKLKGSLAGLEERLNRQ
ncbi:MAG TPA: tetratricopeptide repeat protein [Blastocatellia bacterium]|nr:tetratricopeptide repeat protein [Blastocatellia bacterium]